jgi:hypothetical protein
MRNDLSSWTEYEPLFASILSKKVHFIAWEDNSALNNPADAVKECNSGVSLV